MKPRICVPLIAALVLKMMLASIFIFRVMLDTVWGDAGALATAQEKTVATRPAIPEIGSEDNRIDLALLLQKKAELQAREEALIKQKAELTSISEDISARLEKLSQLRNEIKAELIRKETIEREKLRHLIRVYSAMKPQNAAALIEKLDQKLAVELLANMKGEIVGSILSFMEKDKAVKIVAGLAAR